MRFLHEFELDVGCAHFCKSFCVTEKFSEFRYCLIFARLSGCLLALKHVFDGSKNFETNESACNFE